MNYDLKFTLLWERFSIRWLLMRALQKQLQAFSRHDYYTVFLIFVTIYVPILYLPTFSESNAWDFHLVMTGIYENVPLRGDFRRFPMTFRRLPNVAEMPTDVPKTFELLKVAQTDLFARWLFLNRVFRQAWFNRFLWFVASIIKNGRTLRKCYLFSYRCKNVWDIGICLQPHFYKMSIISKP